MKIYCTIALFVAALSVNALGQETDSAYEWEITFGRSSGRVHKNIVRQTINSEGRKTYLDKKNGTPAVGQIPQQEVDEISGLLNRLNLPLAKAISSAEFNKCVVSPHLPNTYFSLARNNKTIGLSHCNGTDGTDGKKFEYTLDLSLHQQTMYEFLREKIEALFDDKIKQKVG